MSTNKVADYIVITDAPSQLGGFGGMWNFTVPPNIDLDSKAVLYFVLRDINADDLTLNVTINGKKISAPPYLTFNGDDHPYRTMHEVFKPKDVNINLDQDQYANTLKFEMNAQDDEYLTVSDIVLWFQVDSGKMPAILLDGTNGNIFAGARLEVYHTSTGETETLFGQGKFGDLYLNNDQGEQRIRLEAGQANLWIGGNLAEGDIMVYPSHVTKAPSKKWEPDEASFHLDGHNARLTIGSGESVGSHVEEVVIPNSKSGKLVIRGALKEQKEGIQEWEVKTVNRIVMFADVPDADAPTGRGAHVLVGGHGANGQMWLYPSSASDYGSPTIRLNGETGEIDCANCDCAEDFEVEEGEAVEPGTVLVIGEDAKLHVSHRAYDKRVAGVVSGAGDYRPGIVLGRRAGQQTNRLPVALVGRVFCKVDADQGAIEIGDLLTSSSEPGYAMKASDPVQAFGAVLGKALSSLGSGRGLIPVMVALH
ncbi:MAG TPA: hypothetical protein VFB38_16720 [Chthonomonadaceae bacterium]|nr:hypothetical protein [Chthonomonadaceae bacterium]